MKRLLALLALTASAMLLVSCSTPAPKPAPTETGQVRDEEGTTELTDGTFYNIKVQGMDCILFAAGKDYATTNGLTCDWSMKGDK